MAEVAKTVYFILMNRVWRSSICTSKFCDIWLKMIIRCVLVYGFENQTLNNDLTKPYLFWFFRVVLT